KDEDKSSGIGRPLKIIDALGDIGEFLRFATTAIKEPDLVLGAVASGEEGQIFSVGTPSRMIGRNAFCSQWNGIAAVSGNHPEALLVFVVLENSSADGIRDPLAIGA